MGLDGDRGRIVKMPARPVIPYKVGWQVDYEYWQEQLGRAVLWAADRLPEVKLNIATKPEIPRAVLAGGRDEPATVSWQNAKAGMVAEVTLRGWNGQQRKLGTAECNTTNGAFAFGLPLLPAGDYHVNAIARSDRGVEAWATSPFTVTSPASVESLELKWHMKRPDDILERWQWHTPWAEVGQELSGTVEAAGVTQGQTLRIRLMDRRARVLVRKDFNGNGPHEFSFAVEPWMPALVRVEAVILDGENEVASDYRFFLVTKRRRGRFNFVLWDYPVGETLAPYAAEHLRRMGVTVILASRPAPLSAAAYELTWAPWTGAQIQSSRAESWHDDGATNYYKGHVGTSRPHGAFVYSLGDEGSVSGAGVGPKAVDAYRKYLKEVYGEVAALNNSWGTDFDSFEKVTLSEAKDSNESSALKAGNYARWYDRQAFHRHNFVQHCKAHAEAMREMDPETRIGFEGSGRFARSADPDLVCRELGFWVPYASSIDEIIRSIASRDYIRANWMGYHWTADGLLSKYWRMVTNGCDSVWWWMWSAMGAWHGFQAPDLGAYPATEEMLRETQVVRDGLGDLLINCEMLDDGIAMLYSMPSSFAVTLDNSSSYGQYETNHRAWYTVIHDLAMQFRYVTDRMMDRGEFQADQFKVLILPQAIAVSPQTAAAVRDFAAKGGTVIADVRPGVYDGHCKPQEKGILDDLFGVAGPVRAGAGHSGMTIDGSIGERKLELKWADAIIDPTVKLAGGKALGQADGVPVFIVREVGKGRAVLLNFAMSSFPAREVARGLTQQASWEEAPVDEWKLVKEVFGAAGVEPEVQLRQYKSKRPFMGNVKVQRWKNGDMEIMSLFREKGVVTSGGGLMGSVALAGEPRYIYDITHQIPVGQTGWWVTDVIPSRASFFALLPREIAAPRIELAGKAVSRGERAIVRVSVPGASGLHGLKLRVSAPDGSPVEQWEQVVVVGDAPKDIALPVAYNDPAGSYTISATDVFTPETAVSTQMQVK